MSALQRMIRWFIPKEEHFFDYVEAAALATDDAAQALVAMVHAGDHDAMVAQITLILDAEHRGDQALREMADALDRTFVTPIDREDLYRLTAEIETVSDVIFGTANQVIVHRMATLPDGSVELAEIVGRATATFKEAVGHLRDARKWDSIRLCCSVIERLEHDADGVFRTKIGEMFAEETDAIRLLKHKEFLEGLEDAADHCADVARVLEGILIKHG